MTRTRLSIREQVQTFIVKNLLYDDLTDLRDSTSLIEEGIVDSMGIMELVSFLEREFAIKVKDDELVPDNLDSIDAIISFLERKDVS